MVQVHLGPLRVPQTREGIAPAGFNRPRRQKGRWVQADSNPFLEMRFFLSFPSGNDPALPSILVRLDQEDHNARPRRPPLRPVTIDCPEPAALARFYGSCSSGRCPLVTVTTWRWTHPGRHGHQVPGGRWLRRSDVARPRRATAAAPRPRGGRPGRRPRAGDRLRCQPPGHPGEVLGLRRSGRSPFCLCSGDVPPIGNASLGSADKSVLTVRLFLT
jgi:hypothetical protein